MLSSDEVPPMKCPKCGYNSFEFNDVCKRCAQDLTSYKVSYGLKPIVLPQETRTALAAAQVKPEPDQVALPQQTAEVPPDMFSFELPAETPAPTATTIDKDDFFKFDEPPAATKSTGYGTFSFDDEQSTQQAKAVEDAFADLLETAETGSTVSFAEQKSPVDSGTPAEYELTSFSWDEPGDTTTAGEKKPDDDFESLFGDIGSSPKK
jgi:hypothetical protein